MSLNKESAIRKLLGLFFLLYVLALPTSMGIMEISSWTCLALVLALFAFQAKEFSPPPMMPFYIIGSLYLWSLLGGVLQGFDRTRMLYAFGDFRWALLLLSFFFCFKILLTQKNYVQLIKKYFLGFFLILLSLIAVYGIYQYFTGVDFIRGSDHRMATAVEWKGRVLRWRSSGFFSMPLTYAYSMGMFLSALFPFLLLKPVKERWWLSALVWICFTLGSVSLITSFSRGAWLAYLAAILAALFLLLKFKQFVVASLVFVALLIGAYFVSPNVQDRVNSISDFKHRSNSDRQLIWQSHWMMFTDNPIIGVGYRVDGELTKVYLDKLNAEVEYPGHAHNNILQFFAVTGLIGGLLYLSLIFLFLLLNWKAIQCCRDSKVLKSLMVGLFSAQIMFHMGGMSECNFFDAEVRHLIVFLWAFVLYCYYQLSKDKASLKSQWQL